MIKLFFFSFIILLFFKPTPNKILGSVGMKVPDLLYLFLFIGALFYLCKKQCKFKLPVLFNFFLIICVYELFVLFVFSISTPNLVFEDLTEILRMFLILTVIMVSYNFPLFENINKDNEKYSLFIIYLFIIFSWFIFFNIFGFKDFSSYFYEVSRSRGFSDQNTLNIFRLSSTFTNPNYFGIFCVFSTFFFFFNKRYFISFVFLIFLFLSGSRTSIIALIISFLSYNIIKTLITLSVKRLIVFISLIILIFYFIFINFNILEPFLWRFTNIDNLKNNLFARFSVWLDIIDYNNGKELYGSGTSKYLFNSVDGNYALIYLKGGIINLILHFILFVYILFVLFNNAFIQNCKHAVILFTFTIALLVHMTTAVTFNMVQIYIPYFVYLSYYMGNYRGIISFENTKKLNS